MWRGKPQGREVAIEVLKIWRRSNHGQIRRVSAPWCPIPAVCSYKLTAQAKISVDPDSTARIAGLGPAFVPSRNHATWSEVGTELWSHEAALESIRPDPPGFIIITTKGSDFGLLTWEVSCSPLILFESLLIRTNQVFVADRYQFAAIHLPTNRIRPLRPHRPELSDRVWDMIQRCWHHNPSRRMPIRDIDPPLNRRSLSANAAGLSLRASRTLGLIPYLNLSSIICHYIT